MKHVKMSASVNRSKVQVKVVGQGPRYLLWFRMPPPAGLPPPHRLDAPEVTSRGGLASVVQLVLSHASRALDFIPRESLRPENHKQERLWLSQTVYLEIVHGSWCYRGGGFPIATGMVSRGCHFQEA